MTDNLDEQPDWTKGLAERLAQYVIWQTLFAQDADDLDDIDTVEVWIDVCDHLDAAINKIWARWDPISKRRNEPT